MKLTSIMLFHSKENNTIYAQARVKMDELYYSTSPLSSDEKLDISKVDELCDVELKNLKSLLEKQEVDLAAFDELAQVAFENFVKKGGK